MNQIFWQKWVLLNLIYSRNISDIGGQLLGSTVSGRGGYTPRSPVRGIHPPYPPVPQRASEASPKEDSVL